jgi:hypothetical protein
MTSLPELLNAIEEANVSYLNPGQDTSPKPTTKDDFPGVEKVLTLLGLSDREIHYKIVWKEPIAGANNPGSLRWDWKKLIQKKFPLFPKNGDKMNKVLHVLTAYRKGIRARENRKKKSPYSMQAKTVPRILYPIGVVENRLSEEDEEIILSWNASPLMGKFYNETHRHSCPENVDIIMQ